MRQRSAAAAVAIGAVLSLVLSACGGDDTASKPDTGTGGATTAAYNAGVGKVYNPSTTKGGTLRMAHSADWDSLDPGDTYYAFSWNFVRLYTRTLTMFKSAPGAGGAELVPDLAESLGKSSNGAKTWTYTLKEGVKFEDGTPITSKDVKYAVSRSLDKATFVNGPTYFNDFLEGAADYKGVYKAKDGGLKSIETPDDKTIVFNLSKPFGGFDYLAMLPATAPVPQAKDTGIKYKEKVISSGPYKFKENNLGKNFTLVRNEAWDAATDPNRPALPDQIEVALNVNADDIDNRLLSGDLDVDIEGSGVRPAAQGRILGDPKLKANADSALVARTSYTSINPNVAPLDNLDCRKAVEFAADKTSYQNAYGGPTGGDIATGLLPPVIPGFAAFDLYGAKDKPTGDVDKAKAALSACGQPNGFATNISYRPERPKEKAAAEGLQQSLAKVGIKLTLKPYPQDDYFALYAGKPGYAKSNKLGLVVNSWGADWPDGFGFLQQITDSRVIRATGGSSNISVAIPAVDKLIDQALAETDLAAQQKLWPQIDKLVMEDARVFPGIWVRGLLYRPETLTNVFVTDGFQQYDYLAMGVAK
jgi:peptide/nickel transport system substrate-binding protein